MATVIGSSRGGVFRFGVAAEPGIPFVRIVNNHGGTHASVIRATELCADDRITTGSRGREAELGRLPRNHVLLETKLRDPEGMNHILCLHVEGHWPIGGYVQLSSCDVSLWVMKEKGKLHCGHINGQCHC